VREIPCFQRQVPNSPTFRCSARVEYTMSWSPLNDSGMLFFARLLLDIARCPPFFLAAPVSYACSLPPFPRPLLFSKGRERGLFKLECTWFVFVNQISSSITNLLIYPNPGQFGVGFHPLLLNGKPDFKSEARGNYIPCTNVPRIHRLFYVTYGNFLDDNCYE
jgi:hypothetical protein